MEHGFNQESRGELFRMEERGGRAFGDLALFLFGAAVGSLAMYLLDPFQGRRRRALLRDKGVAFSHDLADFSRKHARDLANRSQGMIARMRHREGEADDSVLVSRVRSKFGRKVTHPKAVHVESRDGVITLTGHVLEEELDDLLAAVESVEGVSRVENRLESHREAGNIPSLQGQGPDYLH